MKQNLIEMIPIFLLVAAIMIGTVLLTMFVR
jgi:hypothetical protein